RQTAQLPLALQGDTAASARRQADSLLSDLSALSLDALARAPGTVTEAVPAFCASFTAGLEKLSDLITEHYFSHAAARNGRREG
ncbi:MAG TPA: hypothetical protein PLP58_22420, partial [Prosthecobacter sp.]|nr:hypothetical protein [Prosthecobacter sp.]